MNNKKELYLVETGVLLAKEDKEYEMYANVYDKENGYYDLNQYFITKEKLEETIKCEKEYLEKNCFKNIYIIITYQDIWEFDSEEELEELDTNFCDYLVENIVYSVMKDKNGNIIENFIKRGQSYEL